MTRAAFSRESPDSRRQALMDATAQCLAENGPAGTSVRAVCARAGVSPGLLRHYFDGIDDLVAATYANICKHVQALLMTAVDAAGQDPRQRILAYIGANFRPPVAEPDLLATWTAFWTMIRHNPEMSAIHEQSYAAFRESLGKLLGALDLDEKRIRFAAIALTALIDGLWVELSLNTSVFTAEEAQEMASLWLDALLGPGTTGLMMKA